MGEVQPEVGNLVAIDFIEQEGTAVARAIQVLPYGPEVFDDGPYVFWKDDATAILRSHIDGKVVETVREEIVGPTTIATPHPNVPTILLDPVAPSPPPARHEMPSKLMVISDLEGNFEAFTDFLRGNGIINEDGHWSWGDGRLVLVGAMVDRGSEVTELLWMIRRLEREAASAGGGVDYILGNHEAMVLAGDLRYIHPKYVYTSGALGREYQDLFGPDTELGRWLRSRNAVERIGNIMFIHAGYSPQLDALALEPSAINERIRSSLGPPAWPQRDQLGPHLAWHSHGPLWYRGYFRKYAESWDGFPTDTQIDAILTRNGVAHIAVGHTVVPDIGWLDTGRRLLGIDVKWSEPGEAEGLLVIDGAFFRVDTAGKRSQLEVVQHATQE